MTANKYEIAFEVARQNLDKIKRNIPPYFRTRIESLYKNSPNYNLDPLKRLEALYKEMDIIYSFVQQFSPCKKGCDHCCYYEIAISDIEVQYIERNVNITEIKGKIKSRHNKACPFLNEGVCTIYQYRPFFCRRHLSLTNSERWCKENICNKYNFPLIEFPEIDQCYADIISSSSVRDIRDAFLLTKNHF